MSLNDMIEVDANDLRVALSAMLAAAAIIKRRFPNLTVVETNEIAKEVIQAIHGVTR